MSSILPFGGYEPDKSSYMGASSQTIQNAVPRADGYGPFPDFSAFASELAEGNDGFTKVLLQFNGADASTTITDVNAGGSAHTWTANGNAQIDTAQSKFGGASLLCDGTGDYVTTPDHADFTLGSSDFTIDCWFQVQCGRRGRSCCSAGRWTTRFDHCPSRSISSGESPIPCGQRVRGRRRQRRQRHDAVHEC